MTSLKVCFITFILTLFYLICSVFISNILFYYQSNGSLIKTGHKITGSKLIGQEFKNRSYFQNRPSANNYRNNISGCSNFSFYSEELQSFIKTTYENFKSTNNNKFLDLNLISESASGIDPHITDNGAISQIERVSITTGLSKEEIMKLIEKASRRRICGLFGEKIVNVLELNLKLRDLYAKKSRTR